MKNGMRLIFVTIPIAAIGAAVLAYMVITSPPPERNVLEERATAVRYIVTKTQAVAPVVVGFGLVQPARTYEAIAQVGGTVEYVNPGLVKGAILPAGSMLVRLSPADFKLAIAQSQANIRAIQAKLAELTVSEDNQKAALIIELDALDLKQKDLERAERLFAGNTVTQSILDAARSTLLVQRQKVLTIESTLSLLPTQKEVQREQIAVYQTNLEIAELNLARTKLTLPFSARVASVSVETGQYLSSGKTSAVLDGIDIAEIEAEIPIAPLRMLLKSTQTSADSAVVDPTRMTEILRNLNLTAEVRLSLGQEVIRWTASVDRISDNIDRNTGTLGVIVQVDGAYSATKLGDRPPLTKGMFVEVVLSARPITGYVVPRSAVRDGHLLVSDTENRLQLLAVVPELLQDEIALITHGLADGMAIVVSSPSPAIPGMLLELTEDTELEEQIALVGQVK